MLHNWHDIHLWSFIMQKYLIYKIYKIQSIQIFKI